MLRLLLAIAATGVQLGAFVGAGARIGGAGAGTAGTQTAPSVGTAA